MRPRLRNLALTALLAFAAGLFVLSCSAGTAAYRKGESAERLGNWDAALVHYTRAVNENPENIEYRLALERIVVETAAYHVQQAQKKLAAEDLRGAAEELELSVDLDPSNRYAQDILQETNERLEAREAAREDAGQFETRRRRAQELFGGRPILEPSSTAPIQLRFAEDTSLQKIFEVLSKLSGVNILFDESFRDKRVTVDLTDVSFEEALDKLVLINRLFYKIVDASTIIIVPDNAQKHRQYDDLVLRTFFIVNAEVNTVANMLRTIAGIQRVQPNPELKSITVRATPDQVAVAERIVELNDKSKSEIMLDIEILEINRSKVFEYGLQAAEYQASLGFAPAGQNAETGAIRLNRLASVDSSDFLVTFPTSASFRLFKSKSEARLLASPKLRASEGQPAELRLGQEVPIPVTSFVSQFGTPGGIPQTPVTSFQYRNVGINVSITPKVFVDGEIELQLSLETSTQLDTRIIGGIELPVFGTRTREQRRAAARRRDQPRRRPDSARGSHEHLGLSRVDRRPASEQNLRVERRAGRLERRRLFHHPAHREGAPRQRDRPRPPADGHRAADQGPRQPAVHLRRGGRRRHPRAPARRDGPRGRGDTGGSRGPRSRDTCRAGGAARHSRLGSLQPADGEPDCRRERLRRSRRGGAQGLSSGDLTLSYDAASLRVSDVQAGAFLSIDGKPVTFTPTFSPGQLRVVFTRGDDTEGLRGSGHLVRLTFETLRPAPALIVSATGSLRSASGQSIPASFSSLRIDVREP